ncbi:MAG: hypothetical protein ABW063_04010, partial [Caulobacter sp.]
YGPDRLVDSKILALAARFSYVLDPAATLADAASGELGLILRSGRRLQRRVHHPLGAPQNPMSQDDIVAKFTACARLSRRALESEQVESLRETILNLDRIERPCSRLAVMSGGS